MKRYFLFVLLLCTHFLMGQTRNFRLVNAPTKKPTTQQRKAVVIGMGDYGDGRSLNNTVNDARDMSTSLSGLGFEVTLLTNNDLRSLNDNLNKWYNSIEGNDMAIFYFAGHGMEVKGENYLVPVGANMGSETDVMYNTLNVNQVLANMEEKNVGMKLVILDACRDNPFKRSWTRGAGSKGLAQVFAPRGTYVAFAASPGSTAQDGGNYKLKNGVFTHYLKQEIVREGLSIDEIFTNVANQVTELTAEQQTPFRNSSLRKNFYFLPPNSKPPDPQPAETFEKYFYYIDQAGNESQDHFGNRQQAEAEMKAKKLYGKVYSNFGDVFVVKAPVLPNEAEPNSKSRTGAQQKLANVRNYYRNDSSAKAFAIYNSLPESDLDGEAINTLGSMYEYGHGVVKDTIQARNWYVKAKNWYQQAADAGSISAMEALADMYAETQGIRVLERDYEQAKQLYQRSAEGGSMAAMIKLGTLYQRGLGGEQNYTEAKKWYEKAADKGNTVGMFLIGYLYEFGAAGFPIDQAQAKYWYQKSANGGNSSAKQKIANLKF